MRACITLVGFLALMSSGCSPADHRGVNEMIDCTYFRTTSSFRPGFNINGWTNGVQVEVDIHYIALNSEGRCQKGIVYGATNSFVPKAEGGYRIAGEEILLSWSDGTTVTARLSADRQQLGLDGGVFTARRNKE